jgi:hypothetical protein
LPPRCAGETRALLGWLADCPLDDGEFCALLRDRIRSAGRTADRLAAALVLAHWRDRPSREHWIEQGRLASPSAAPAPLSALAAYQTYLSASWAQAAG